MPSRYRRKPGSRRYVDYTDAELEECLDVVRSKLMTQREAAVKYNIPWSTMKNKLKKRFGNKPGRPAVFSEQEENTFVAHITALSEFGFPLTDFDLKMIVKDYLSAQGRNMPQFKNNVPGKDWLRSFLNRHKVLSRRMANNIKRVRAQISEDDITAFIENLSTELDNIPAENIYNYDETNLSDDPGRKTVLCRRGTKYPEVIVNATKVSFTVMFCGNAAGEEVPPYIIYKAQHLWTTWTSNGPKNAKYNRTKSGWIDSATFEDWFINHLIPILKKKDGRKVVIGDNLSSHINPRVLSECEKHKISFICLPPNATHILQPLDVAYFRPLKCKWRQVLQNWKDSQSGRMLPTTPKDVFPSLLKQALDSLTNTNENLIAGFKKTGIFPIDKEQPLSRLPRQDRIVDANLIGDSFMQKLQENRANICPEKKTVKKKKLIVPPGKSIAADDLTGEGPSGQQPSKIIGKTKKEVRNKQTKRQRSTSTTSFSDVDMSITSSTADHMMPWDDDEDEVPIANEGVDCPGNMQAKNISEGDYVLVVWNSQKYPGQVTSAVNEEGALVSCMKKGKLYWRWPVCKDEQLYSWDNIMCKINIPKLEKKGCFSVFELDG